MRRGSWLLAGAISLAACGPILGIRNTAGPRPFEHHAHVEKGINCRECHAGIASAGDTGPLHLPQTADCMRCHTKPHDTRACDGCHGLSWAREGAALARENLRFEHATHVSRVRGDCVRCHEGVTRDADRVRPPMALCLSCHQHRDQFATRNCEMCHVDLRGEHVLPESHVAHEGDFLREHGVRAAAARDLCATCHSERFCGGCHGATVAVLPERLHFDDPLRPGVHRAGFLSRHPNEARTQPGLCTTCHATSTCESCHERRGVRAVPGTRSPHPPGWSGLRGQRNDHGRAAWRDPAECASCHSGAGEALCVGCHSVGGPGGNPHRPGWQSTLRPTIDAPCRACHGAGR